MNWVNTLWPMFSAASLTLALVYCLAWIRTPTRISQLLIGVAAAAVATVGLFELGAMNAGDTTGYTKMVRWAHVPVALSAVCVVGFVVHHYGAGSPVLAIAAIITRIACLVPNFFSGANLNYATIDSLRRVDFLGTQVSIPDVATANSWMALGTGNALLIMLFLAHAIVQLSRRRASPERTRAIATCATILAFVIAAGSWTWMVVHDRIEAPHLFAPMFLGVLLAMAFTLAGGYSSAGRLAHSLAFALGRRRIARRRMLQAVGAAGIGVWSLDARSGQARLSDQAHVLLGAPPDGALGLGEVLGRFFPEGCASLASVGTEPARGFHREFPVQLPDGRQRWLAAHGRWMDAGDRRTLDGVLMDITSRKESEAQFRSIVEAASTPHLVVGPSGAVKFANQQAAAIFGHQAEAVVGMDLRSLIRWTDGRVANADDQRRTGPPSADIGQNMEVVGIRAGGASIPLAAAFNPVPFESDLLLLVSLVDLSETRRREREEAIQHDESVHASRVSLLETLSGSLAHELNQPLTAILANVQAAQRFLAQPVPDLDEVRASLEAIADSDLRASGIMRRLRALLRKDDSEFRPFDLAEAIEEAAGLLRSDLLIREASLRIEVARPLPPVLGDPIQIQQVVLNLVVNACDAMAGRPAPRPVSLRAAVEGDAIRVTVSDCGDGIAAGDLERIFQPFHTRKAESLGLGLAVCRAIVLAHRGRIWAESRGEGHGATVGFRLPTIARADQADAAGAARHGDVVV